MRADDGCLLWTEQAGDGPPLVFCHGGPGLWDYFDGVAGTFADRARTVRWDQRGCGRSERRGPYTIERFIADLDSVRGGAERITLLGHSWGATLALLYTLAHPDRVSGLIYVSGTGIDPDDTWRPPFHRNLQNGISVDLERWKELDGRRRTADEDREHAILQWTADFVDPATGRQHAERLGTPWLGINDECAGGIKADLPDYLTRHDVPASCRTLPVPTLIIDGELDIRPRWAVDSLERALPNARRTTLSGAGHVPWVEEPARFHQAVSGFLAETT
jgi:proline iminopeptidase